MSEKLLPCPFCGGDGLLSHSIIAASLWKVTCKHCDAGRSSGIGSAAAIKEWNTRIGVAPTPDHSGILAVIDPWTRGAFTGWTGRRGFSRITLDEAEDHFSLCMKDMMDAVREHLKSSDGASGCPRKCGEADDSAGSGNDRNCDDTMQGSRPAAVVKVPPSEAFCSAAIAAVPGGLVHMVELAIKYLVELDAYLLRKEIGSQDEGGMRPHDVAAELRTALAAATQPTASNAGPVAVYNAIHALELAHSHMPNGAVRDTVFKASLALRSGSSYPATPPSSGNADAVRKQLNPSIENHFDSALHWRVGEDGKGLDNGLTFIETRDLLTRRLLGGIEQCFAALSSAPVAGADIIEQCAQVADNLQQHDPDARKNYGKAIRALSRQDREGGAA